MNRNRFSLSFILFLFLTVPAVSQVPFAVKRIDSDFYRGLELFNKEKYPGAIRLFDKYIDGSDGADHLLLSEAEYYSALASLRLFNYDAEYRMVRYISSHPESPDINDAWLALADYFYHNRSYRKAYTYYEAVNRQELDGDALSGYLFKSGYSHYMSGDKSRALLFFSEIKDIDTDYTSPALYYFSQIAYEREMYSTAMDGFMRLRDDETFGAVVPFYIVQILYMEKDYDGILGLAPGLVDAAGKERAVELYRFIGDAHYNKGDYSEALPYLEQYTSEARASGREDKYQLGYCYYKTGDLDKAIEIFLEIRSRNDLLSQNIWNILGDCYLRQGDKKRSQFAFGEASKMDHDKEIKEEALFNYAKLTYETSYSPFGETIEAFQEYIDLYPGSERIQEAYEYLIATYTQARNYKAAITSLDRIPDKDNRLQEAYQKVAFFRGLELYKNLQFEASVTMFDKSLEYERYDRSLRARARYWRGEANYRLREYEIAREDYELFMGIPGSLLLDEYNLVRYNLGYTCYNMKDYENALIHFRSFEEGDTDRRAEVLADAQNRIADCYYISTDYRKAIEYYDKVIGFGRLDSDYALYQKGFSMGLINDNEGKIEILTSLIVNHPASSYAPAAVFERGRAHLVLEDYNKGESDFKAVITDYPSSPYVPRAMVQLGLLYYNMGENDKAISWYKDVIENFRSTDEARYALTGLRNTYVEINDVEGYFTYIKTLDGYGDINMAGKDSLLFTSGENLYIAGSYEKAAGVFQNYVSEFPEGAFRQNAQYYLAESLRSLGKKDEALAIYTLLAEEPNNQFMEQVLIAASAILFEKEEYDISLDYYERLENVARSSGNRLISLSGQLRSAYQAGDAAKTISAADKLNDNSNIPEELIREATFMSGKAHYSLNEFDRALEAFRKVAVEVTSIEGAESKYRVAEILYKNDEVEEAENIIYEFIDQNTPHQYWMARIFLLLAEISMGKGDTLQARATLQSLNDYYSVDDDGILDEVKARLDELDGVEAETDNP